MCQPGRQLVVLCDFADHGLVLLSPAPEIQPQARKVVEVLLALLHELIDVVKR